ncbi:RNA polymerase II transcription factor [Hamiltosporidium magnivora]|uniref:RNA polymerase II transcription factor n=1 Tax=Hamiltosporidium magnivora TaxID=148818 RepID=A0A4Q9L9V8_9MICR|nr:RNA polymerase II transcription factor [Hamiltosporidium magnivora]
MSPSNFFSWEQQYKRTWEDASPSVTSFKQIAKKYDNRPLKRLTIKHLHIIIDTSVNLDHPDFHPFRFSLISILNEFHKNFTFRNKVSKISFSNLQLEYYNEPTTNLLEVCEKLFDIQDIIQRSLIMIDASTKLLNEEPAGIAKINSSKIFKENYKEQTGDQQKILKVKNTCLKEFLIISGSLSTKSVSSDLFHFIKKNNLKIHFISLGGEVSIFKKVSQTTGGKYFVPLNIHDFANILMEYCIPEILTSNFVSMIPLGFPLFSENENSVCVCHSTICKGYSCVTCGAKVCTLPISCPICNTQLISSSSLIQNIYYSFPLKQFSVGEGLCKICGLDGKWMCNDCKNTYCDTCDSFIHENLKFCLFCD